MTVGVADFLSYHFGRRYMISLLSSGRRRRRLFPPIVSSTVRKEELTVSVRYFLVLVLIMIAVSCTTPSFSSFIPDIVMSPYGE